MKFQVWLVALFCSQGFNLVNSQNPDLKRTYHWYFGDSTGIDFSSGLPVLDTNGVLTTLEGCATISDTSGRLLFYTDGTYVWDSTHTQMPNGFGLHGNWSALNSAVIVPQPGNDHIYYIFTVPAYAGHWTPFKGMEYNVVDMNLNGGLGDVVTKNVVLFSAATEGLGAVRHANGIDYWVVGHQVSNSYFMAYLVTSAGVASTPVISNIGVHAYDYDSCWFCAGNNLKFSPSGCRLAVAYNNLDSIELFDFDISSGTVMNQIGLHSSYSWGLCFSPDEKFLYATGTNYSTLQDQLLQFNLTSNNSSSIMASKTVISNGFSIESTMQLGPDGKIYCSLPYNTYLSVINNPNNAGLGCNFQLFGFSLGNRICQTGITNFVQSYFKNDSTTYSCSYVGLEEIEKINFNVFPNPMTYETTISSDWEFNSGILSVYNIHGQKEYEMTNINGKVIHLFREDLMAGLYVIRLFDSKKFISTLKLIVID